MMSIAMYWKFLLRREPQESEESSIQEESVDGGAEKDHVTKLTTKIDQIDPKQAQYKPWRYGTITRFTVIFLFHNTNLNLSAGMDTLGNFEWLKKRKSSVNTNSIHFERKCN